MSCTTILVGKEASYDGSTMTARNDDSSSGKYDPKKFVVVNARKKSEKYVSVISKFKIKLPEGGMRYTAVPNAVEGKGIWAAGGVNELNIAMTATETITSNARVLGADPLVEYEKGEGKKPDSLGGIGEEDIVALVLPYIKSARDGVKRLGRLLEEYGTYEMNGIAFQDQDEIWWLESIGGHHWIARKVPDNAYVVMPNQLGIDFFNISDALGGCKAWSKDAVQKEDGQKSFEDEKLYADQKRSDDQKLHDVQKVNNEQNLYVGQEHYIEKNGKKDENNGEQREFMCSSDLREFIKDNHLGKIDVNGCESINPRIMFGSHDDSDHIYNTPRAWYMERFLNRKDIKWDGEAADYTPESDNIPWSMVPDEKITVEDVKYLLSSHYQGTIYDPYRVNGNKSMCGVYRSIGVNRNNFLSLFQIRPYICKDYKVIEWLAFGSNAFNAFVPFYTNVDSTPEYFANTAKEVSTDNFYWTNRLIAVLTDADFIKNEIHIERYQAAVQAAGWRIINKYDAILNEAEAKKRSKICIKANEEIAEIVKKETQDVLYKVLHEATNDMKNGYIRSDA